MVTLSYGTLPEFKQFRSQFSTVCAYNGMYKLIVSDSDVANGARLNLDVGGLYDCESLYDLCDELWRGAEFGALESEEDELAKWSAEFLSHLLYALGIKWV